MFTHLVNKNDAINFARIYIILSTCKFDNLSILDLFVNLTTVDGMKFVLNREPFFLMIFIIRVALLNEKNINLRVFLINVKGNYLKRKIMFVK